jgi:hypothetical protein
MTRSPRQEFTDKVKDEIKARAIDYSDPAHPEGVRRCECCGCPVRLDGEEIEGARLAAVDHTVAEWTRSATPLKQRKKLTANDGKLICVDGCHADKSRRETMDRARIDAAGKRYRGERRPRKLIPSRGFQNRPTKMSGRVFGGQMRKLQNRGFQGSRKFNGSAVLKEALSARLR